MDKLFEVALQVVAGQRNRPSRQPGVAEYMEEIRQRNRQRTEELFKRPTTSHLIQIDAKQQIEFEEQSTSATPDKQPELLLTTEPTRQQIQIKRQKVEAKKVQPTKVPKKQQSEPQPTIAATHHQIQIKKQKVEAKKVLPTRLPKKQQSELRDELYIAEQNVAYRINELRVLLRQMTSSFSLIDEQTTANLNDRQRLLAEYMQDQINYIEQRAKTLHMQAVAANDLQIFANCKINWKKHDYLKALFVQFWTSISLLIVKNYLNVAKWKLTQKFKK